MGGLCNVASKSQGADAQHASPGKLRVLEHQMQKGPGGFDNGISAPPPADRAAGPAGGHQLAPYQAGAACLVEGQVMPAEQPGHRPPDARITPPAWEEPENIRRLRAELGARDKAAEDLRRESAHLAGLMEILERETFDKELALREAQDIREILLQREEEMTSMRQRAEANEEVLRAVIAEASAKGDAVESLVCSLTQQVHQAQMQRPSVLNAATPVVVKVEGKPDSGTRQVPEVLPRGVSEEEGADKRTDRIGVEKQAGVEELATMKSQQVECQAEGAAAQSLLDAIPQDQDAGAGKETEAAGAGRQEPLQEPAAAQDTMGERDSAVEAGVVATTSQEPRLPGARRADPSPEPTAADGKACDGAQHGQCEEQASDQKELEPEDIRIAAAAALVDAAADGSLASTLRAEAALLKAP